MLYSLLKPLVRISLKGYFRRIDVSAKHLLERERTIYVANHPGAMMDPILLASIANKEVHFIAGAEWFGTGFRASLFKDQFNMIPVFRPWLAKVGDEPGGNDEMFEACYQGLASQKRILIFPEASSQTVPWLRGFKTGAARIKLGADRSNPELPPVQIIPVGINYTNPHRFQSRVLINVGEPVSFSGIDLNAADQKEVARDMTERIFNEMKALVWHVDDPAEFHIVRAAMKLLSDQVMRNEGTPLNDYKRAFQVNRKVIEVVTDARRSSKTGKLHCEEQLLAYINEFESLGLYRFNPFQVSAGQGLLLIGGTLITAPLFLLGFLVNGIPFVVVQLAFDRLVRSRVTGEQKDGSINHAFAGALAYLAGLLVFLAWYTVGIFILSQWFQWWVAWPLFWFCGYWLGRFSLIYFRWAKRSRRMLKWYLFKAGQPNRAKSLLTTRAQLMAELQAIYSSSES